VLDFIAKGEKHNGLLGGVAAGVIAGGSPAIDAADDQLPDIRPPWYPNSTVSRDNPDTFV